MSDIIIYDSQQNGNTGLQETTTPPHEVDAQFLTMWLDGKSEKTRTAYTADMRRFYASVGKSLAEITLPDVQAFRRSLIEQGLKTATVKRTLATVKSVLTFAAKTRYIPFNVGAVVKLPKLEDTLAERIMSEQEMARLLALETNARNHAILALLYRGGLRCSELCNLTWRNMHERTESGQISVFGKGEETRQVLLDNATWVEVVALRGITASLDDFVFQSRQARSRTGKASRRLDASSVWHIVRAAAVRAGMLQKVSPHWFRHAHATHSLENGAPITLVKETLGHKSIATTSRYTHVRPDASSGQYLKV